jgi:glycosyltransferase involved in cell wall biosynthesis
MSLAVILSPDPSNTAGGVERMCTLLAEVLEEAGWTAAIVGPDRPPRRWQFRIGGTYLSDSRRATVVANRLHPDLLVTNGQLGMGWSHKRRRIHVYHGTMVRDARAEGPDLSRRERLRRTFGGAAAEALAGRGATVVSVSEAAAEEVRRLYGVRTDAIIPNGVDERIFRPIPRAEARTRLGLAADGRYCLFVGRAQYRKGADMLASASSQAGYELLIAGSAGTPGARHLGVLSPEALADAYSASDCVLFPSRYEACSYVVLEALACEAPLLTTRVGWMLTFLRGVPEYDELCVEPEHDDIVAHLFKLADLDTAALRRRAREWVLDHNTLERYAERWRDLLYELDLRPSRPSRDATHKARHP